jgi:hypothetical protein
MFGMLIVDAANLSIQTYTSGINTKNQSSQTITLHHNKNTHDQSSNLKAYRSASEDPHIPDPEKAGMHMHPPSST